MAPKSHHHAEASEPNHGYSLSERTSETDDQRIEEVTPLPPPEHLIRFFPIAGTPVEKLVGDTRRSVRRILDGKDGRLLVVITGASGGGNAEVDFITAMPVRVQTLEVGMIVGIAILLSLAAAAYPAWRSTRIEPVEGLRYE